MSKQHVSKPAAAGRSAVERLRGWSNADLIEWAKEAYDDVVEILKEKKYKGLTLSLWESKADFEKYLNGGHGAAFYKLLLQHGKIPAAARIKCWVACASLALHDGLRYFEQSCSCSNQGSGLFDGGNESPPRRSSKDTTISVFSPGTKAVIHKMAAEQQALKEMSGNTERQLEELSKQVEKLKLAGTISAGTAAGMVTEWESKGILKRNVTPWWARPDVTKRPPSADPWEKVLPPGAAEATSVQPHVSQVIDKLAKVSTPLRMLDAHKKVTFFGRKPDIVICPAQYASSLPAAWYIVAIGDVKGRRSGTSETFDNDEIGKMVSFLSDLLRSRPDRDSATGFLTDGFIIQFIRLRISSSEARLDFTADVTRPYFLRQDAAVGMEPCGGDWLHALLSEKPHVLGCPTTELSVDSSVVEITRYLGEGSSSVVWQGKHNHVDVVVKIFRNGHERDLVAEIHNLTAVQGIAGVTKHAGANVSSGVLLLSPIGTPLSPHGPGDGTLLPSAEHFAQLIGIVQAAHGGSIKLLHRDLSWANFFLGPDGKVFLNDWAAAVPLGEVHGFFGALNFAADAVLATYPNPIAGQASHDLDMIVKVMFACAHPAYFDRCFPKLSKDSGKRQFELAIARWQGVRKLEQWKLLFDAADRLQYTTLQQLVIKYLPSVPAELQEARPATTTLAAPVPAHLAAAALTTHIAATSTPSVKNIPMPRKQKRRGKK